MGMEFKGAIPAPCTKKEDGKRCAASEKPGGCVPSPRSPALLSAEEGRADAALHPGGARPLPASAPAAHARRRPLQRRRGPDRGVPVCGCRILCH